MKVIGVPVLSTDGRTILGSSRMENGVITIELTQEWQKTFERLFLNGVVDGFALGAATIPAYPAQVTAPREG